MNKINQILLALFLMLNVSVLSAITYDVLTAETRRKFVPQTVAIERGLQKYVAEYERRLTSAGIDLPWGDLVHITFTDALPMYTLGIAWGMDINDATVIDINRYAWKELTEAQRRLVMFHELSHDLFNLRHFDTEIMNTPMPQYVVDEYVTWSLNLLIDKLKDEE